MGMSPLNAKNVRRLSALVGIEFDRVVGFGHPCEFLGRTADDEHYRIDRRLGTAVLEDRPTHWTSCPADVTDIPVPADTLLDAIWYSENAEDVPNFCWTHDSKEFRLVGVRLVDSNVVLTVEPRTGIALAPEGVVSPCRSK